MLVAAPGQCFQLRDSVAALLQSQGVITDDVPQVPVVIGGVAKLLRFALMLHALVLKEQFALPDIFCFFYHSVFDGPEFFLL